MSSVGICAARMGRASCDQCFPKPFAHRYSCTSAEPYVNTVTTRPPSANPKNETPGVHGLSPPKGSATRAHQETLPRGAQNGTSTA